MTTTGYTVRGRTSSGRVFGRAAALILTLLLMAGAAAPARAAGGIVDLAQAIELVKREVAAAVRLAPPDGPALHIDEAQLDFALVETTGTGGPRLAVPTADFGPGRDAGREGDKGPARQAAVARPALRRAISLDLLVPRPAAQPIAAAADPAAPDAGSAGPLARAIADIVTAARQGAVAEPAFEAKRIGVDLDLAFQRDARGAAVLMVYAADRRIEPRNVHKLRLKLSARERMRAGEAAGQVAERGRVPSPDAAQERSPIRPSAAP